MTESIATFEDSTLIEKALVGQTECFAVLMDRHIAAVRGCISSLVRNASDVDDLVQNTFLKAWLHLSAFRFEANFRTWITRVAINEALTLYRRNGSRPSCQAQENLETFPSRCESPDKTLARSEARRTVRTAVARLPRKYREILTLCDLEELGTQETARHLQANIPMVKSRLFRARQMLAAALNRDAA
jgi:RNA polymerase sigma-70 factor (ECF subfamily)